MGCMCSKGTSANEYVHKQPKKSAKRFFGASRRDEVVVEVDNSGNGATVRLMSDGNEENVVDSGPILWDDGDKKHLGSEKPDMQLAQRPEKIDIEGNGGIYHPETYTIYSIKSGVDGVQTTGGWPSWLTAVAGEAIKGWLPRRADSFEKMGKFPEWKPGNRVVFRVIRSDKGLIAACTEPVTLKPEKLLR